MHRQARQFFEGLKKKHPQYFRGVRVLDCGSLDVNGALRDLFVNSDYTGVDVRAGRNVDVVSEVRNLSYKEDSFDVVISSEMLEHDATWAESLMVMTDLVRPGGLLAFSCAGSGRKVHGVKDVDGHDWSNKPGYYRNICIANLVNLLHEAIFSHLHFEYDGKVKDLYFYGIKR